jgi:NAD(P)-dependent dehydrogenase (short-subunit alcohol dehydrogenase family)
MDVSKAIEVDRVIELITNEHGRLDLLVNNAGVAQPATELIATTDEIIDRVIAVNVRGVLYCSRAAARIMVAQKSGRIINISSQAGKCGVPNWVIYSASKAAVVGMTQALALELAAHSITVNCVCPGPMLTEMTRTSVRDEAEALGRSEEEMLFERGESVPVGRLGTPDDIGAMVAWIASDESAFTTGASFNLTGGESVFF